MATADSLPPETIILILELAAQHNLSKPAERKVALRTLAAAAVVAQSWREPAQALMWLQLDIRDGDVTRLLASLVCGKYRPAEVVLPPPSVEKDDRVEEVLGKLRGIRSLEISGIIWGAVGGDGVDDPPELSISWVFASRRSIVIRQVLAGVCSRWKRGKDSPMNVSGMYELSSSDTNAPPDPTDARSAAINTIQMMAYIDMKIVTTTHTSTRVSSAPWEGRGQVGRVPTVSAQDSGITPRRIGNRGDVLLRSGRVIQPCRL